MSIIFNDHKKYIYVQNNLIFRKNIEGNRKDFEFAGLFRNWGLSMKSFKKFFKIFLRNERIIL